MTLKTSGTLAFTVLAAMALAGCVSTPAQAPAAQTPVVVQTPAPVQQPSVIVTPRAY